MCCGLNDLNTLNSGCNETLINKFNDPHVLKEIRQGHRLCIDPGYDFIRDVLFAPLPPPSPAPPPSLPLTDCDDIFKNIEPGQTCTSENSIQPTESECKFYHSTCIDKQKEYQILSRQNGVSGCLESRGFIEFAEYSVLQTEEEA